MGTATKISKPTKIAMKAKPKSTVSRTKKRTTAPAEAFATAKLFRNGRSQAVRLPKEFQFEGKEVRVSRGANGAVVLEPMEESRTDWEAFFAAMDKYKHIEPIPGGRNQPTVIPHRVFPADWDVK